ncbi:type IV toxin-antitoxin system AbiEi family antitoxin domain-containing protein [Patulibacter minatonensis]|uniref:type IV toxin-antitoxin system AbiEi family antitoxin domain-containing protein n=1 Tax=Patulibacter minatonensis TaxID=298163 RepID=UPI00047DF232|nr:type IV toxin-antitoxin system AbiEi family antitoxin domain-containing protein [Patulibacter minatonensis]
MSSSQVSPHALLAVADAAGRHAADGWREIAALAAAQHGVVSRAQLRMLGLTDRQITRALRIGHLHPLHRGVFAVGHGRVTWEGRAAAAVLACGPRAALGHRSAGVHWNLRPWSSPAIEVVVAGSSVATHRGVVVHRHAGLRPDEVELHDGIRVTTVARTLLDLGAVLAPSALRNAVAQAELLDLFDLGPVLELLARHPRHRGARALREILRSWDAPPRTRSEQEEEFPDLCVRLGLPRPVMNATILGMEIDGSFPDHGVAVELDSWRFHRGIVRWEDDHEKRARLVAGGWVALAYTYRQQRERGGHFVLETLGPALARGTRVAA